MKETGGDEGGENRGVVGGDAAAWRVKRFFPDTHTHTLRGYPVARKS